MIDGINPTLIAGWSLAALLLAAALWPSAGPSARITLRLRAWLAMAGMLIGSAVTVYAHDVMALPSICAALIAGGALGLLLGRGAPRPQFPRLIASLTGLTALAAMALAMAGWLNPHAFALLDDATDRLRIDSAAALAAAIGCGAMAVAGAATILFGATKRAPLPLAILALLPAILCALAFTATLQPLWLIGCGGAASLAGSAMVRRAQHSGIGPAVALTAGLSGWALLSCGALFDHLALLVAGGLAGAAGSLFSARFCMAPGRKGLAPAERRP